MVSPQNGETFKEIRQLLETEKSITPKVAARLTLAAVADINDKIDKKFAYYDEHIKELEQDSILLWAKRNKSIALLLVILLASAPVDTIYNLLKVIVQNIK